jgi:hypothetical protein
MEQNFAQTIAPFLAPSPDFLIESNKLAPLDLISISISPRHLLLRNHPNNPCSSNHLPYPRHPSTPTPFAACISPPSPHIRHSLFPAWVDQPSELPS